jgi:hypothetical protein
LLHSHNAAFLRQFSKFELQGVHRIPQTVHNLLTLTGGSIVNPLHVDRDGNRLIFHHPADPARETISFHQQAIPLVHAGLLVRTHF